jgi:hypothetical protein
MWFAAACTKCALHFPLYQSTMRVTTAAMIYLPLQNLVAGAGASTIVNSA